MFCGCSYAKERETGERKARGGEEKVSHMLCQFVECSFDYYRLIRELWLINKILFCRALEEEEEDAGAPSKYNMLILLLLVKWYIDLCYANGCASL